MSVTSKPNENKILQKLDSQRPIEILPTIEVGPSEFERRYFDEDPDVEVIPIITSSADVSIAPKSSSEVIPSTSLVKKTPKPI